MFYPFADLLNNKADTALQDAFLKEITKTGGPMEQALNYLKAPSVSVLPGTTVIYKKILQRFMYRIDYSKKLSSNTIAAKKKLYLILAVFHNESHANKTWKENL